MKPIVHVSMYKVGIDSNIEKNTNLNQPITNMKYSEEGHANVKKYFTGAIILCPVLILDETISDSDP